LRKTGDIYLVNRTGFVISPLRFYNITYNFENVILKQKIDTVNFHNAFLHATYSDEELEKKHNEVALFEDYRGISVYGTHVYFPEMQWVLCCEIDEAEAMASVNQMQTRLTIFLSIFSFIVLLFAWYYAKNLSEPIKKLDEYAKEITDGDLDVRAEINSSDEIGTLADSFNLMTKSLKEYTDNLETQVNERTKDLQGKIDELQRFKKVTIGRELKMVELKNEIKHLKEKTNRGDQP
jgi:methyl-accepting chemotaxis protein